MTEIDLAPLISALLQIVAVFVLALGSVAINRLARWLRLKGDDEFRTYLETALQNGVSFAVQRLREEGKRYRLGTKHEAIAHATQYVINQVPEAVRRLKLDHYAIARAIEARLPDLDDSKEKPSNA